MENKLISIHFKEKHRCFKKGASIEFKDNLTLLVGDQGVGKSTILKALQNFKSHKEIIAIKTKGKVSTLAFDTEKDNPRMQGSLGRPQDAMFIVQSHFASHGETILPLMEHVTTEKDKLIMIDEPESGLSIRSQYKLVKFFKKAVKNGCQLLVATHSMALIQSHKEVFNLEIMEYQSSKDFLESQKRKMK
jgi:predicted ATPase